MTRRIRITTRLVLLLAVIPVSVFATDLDTETVYKKVALMEKIFDTTMIDSRFALVMQGENTKGVYLDGHGAFFTMEFTFVSKADSKKLFSYLDNLDSLKIFWDRFIGEDEETKEGIALRRRNQLDRIEEELVETIIDYGPTLGFLDSDEWLVLVAFPYSWDGVWDVSPVPLRHLTIRARAGDLYDFSETNLSEDGMRSKVVVLETAD